MQAGKLRHRVVIEQNQATQDTFGAETDAWVSWATVYARVESLSGREYFDQQAAQTLAEVTHRVVIRYRDGITPTLRVVWKGQVFDIEAVIEVESRGRELHLMCREVVDG